jgi:hypothetical protein
MDLGVLGLLAHAEESGADHALWAGRRCRRAVRLQRELPPVARRIAMPNIGLVRSVAEHDLVAASRIKGGPHAGPGQGGVNPRGVGSRHAPQLAGCRLRSVHVQLLPFWVADFFGTARRAWSDRESPALFLALAVWRCAWLRFSFMRR